MTKSEDSIRDLGDIKQINICITGFPEGEEGRGKYLI